MGEGAVAIFDYDGPSSVQIQLNLVADGSEEGRDGSIVDVLLADSKHSHDAAADESHVAVLVPE